MRITHLSEGAPVATAEVTPLPGCAQVAVIHSAFVIPEKRGQGVGQEAHRQRLSRIADDLYDLVVCTVDEANAAQVRILVKNGWRRATVFKSSKTGHIVGLWTKLTVYINN